MPWNTGVNGGGGGGDQPDLWYATVGGISNDVFHAWGLDGQANQSATAANDCDWAETKTLEVRAYSCACANTGTKAELEDITNTTVIHTVSGTTSGNHISSNEVALDASPLAEYTLAAGDNLHADKVASSLTMWVGTFGG